MSTLLRLLLDLEDESDYVIARKLNLSSSAALSRASSGLSRNPKVLKKLASYFTGRHKTAIDADLLTLELSPAAIIGIALFIREKQLSKGNQTQ